MGVLEAFHAVTGDLDQPMLVVTTAAAGERSGCLVGFSTQASIDPARFLVLLSDKNHTYRVALDADALAVHVLGQGDLPLAELFGQETGDEVDKFASCGWTDGPAGMPILDGCDAWFVGRILERQRLGDHVAHLLEPIAAQRRAKVDPLTLHDVSHLEPGHDA